MYASRPWMRSSTNKSGEDTEWLLLSSCTTREWRTLSDWCWVSWPNLSMCGSLSTSLSLLMNSRVDWRGVELWIKNIIFRILGRYCFPHSSSCWGLGGPFVPPVWQQQWWWHWWLRQCQQQWRQQRQGQCWWWLRWWCQQQWQWLQHW